MFGDEVTAAIKAHALSQFPREACGVVMPSGYVPLANTHDDPENFFDCTDQVVPYLEEGILAVVHSHNNNHLPSPSQEDMEQQIAWDVPWGLVSTDGQRTTEPYFWGDMLPLNKLVGRHFRHGPSGTDNAGDCYALIRDYVRFAFDGHAKEFPRGWEWWLKGEKNFYQECFAEAGFERISESDAAPGDIFLSQLRSPVLNHGGILLAGGHVLHHLQGRYSNIEALGSWRKYIQLWVRYVGHS
jgi:proteasome lid subunit RPN8/RPN11